MISLSLIFITICSFIFYGVVGQEKVWLLGPAFVVAYIVITGALIKKSVQLAFAIRKPEHGFLISSFQLPVSTFLWLCFLLWGIAMIPLAAIPFDAKFRVLFVGAVVGSYMVWGQALTTFKDNRIVLGWLVFIVMILALYGLVVHFKNPDQVLWTERYASYDGRLMSTYICPNHFAHLMLMLLPFCLALLFIPQAGIYLKILAGYSFLVFLPTLFLTESRAGWLGSIAAIGVVTCLMALRRSRKLFLALVILVPLCSMLLLFSAWRYSETVQRRAAPVLEFLQGQAEEGVGSESPDFRPQTWLDTLDMIGESLATGHGPGNYRYTYPEYRKRFGGHRVVTGHPHNEYLELTADYGLIGFGLFALAWLYGSIWVLIKSLKAEETRHAFLGFAFIGGVSGTMVHSFFDFEMHVFPNAMVFALLAALASGPLFYEKRRRNKIDCRTRTPDDRAQPPPPHRGLRPGERSEFGKQKVEDGPFEDPSLTKESSTSNLTTILRTVLFWVLTIFFLLLTAVSIQTMLSDYIRVLGDKIETETVRAVGSDVDGAWSADDLFQLSISIDKQNWRTYRELGQKYHDERRHSLDMKEKIEFAQAERKWFELALYHNPKDPEAMSLLGRTLLFLHRAGVMEDPKNRQLSVPQLALAPNLELRTTNLEGMGLELLRQACRYRKFNDQYWWFLGVELRKSGQYEEALEVFHEMETVKRTKSSRKNIQWLEGQLEGPVHEQEIRVLDNVDMGAKATGILIEMDEKSVNESNSLDGLFLLMESK